MLEKHTRIHFDTERKTERGEELVNEGYVATSIQRGTLTADDRVCEYNSNGV